MDTIFPSGDADLALAEDMQIIDDEEFSNGAASVSVFTATDCKPIRLDKFLADLCPNVSREKVKRSIMDGLCTVNGQLCAEPKRKIAQGEIVSIQFAQLTTEVTPVQLNLEYIYKDSHLVVVNKPSGITVHPCPSCQETTLVHGVAADFPQLLTIGGPRPGIVHRLDKETSGVMVVALTEASRLRLTEAFAEREVSKSYIALVHGVPPESGTCTEPMGRHPKLKVKMAVVEGGRYAHTEWERLYTYPDGKFSLIRVCILTGRTHQIRVHMQHLGYPLLGDTVYTLPRRYTPFPDIQRQMLHAWKLELPLDVFESGHVPRTTVSRETATALKSSHPARRNASTSSEDAPIGLESFYVPLPEDFLTVARRLTPSGLRVVITGCPGCGKSAVLKLLQEKGCKICSTDTLVHGLYTKESILARSMASHFGKIIIDPHTGEIDRKKLYAMMCDDDTVRHDVNRLVHPYVMEKVDKFFSDPLIPVNAIRVVEIPLWFECAVQYMAAKPDLTIGVSCTDSVRHERLQITRAWSSETCKIMDSWQIPQEEKMRQTNVVIENSSSAESLTQNAAALYERLLEIQAKKCAALENILQKLTCVPKV